MCALSMNYILILTVELLSRIWKSQPLLFFSITSTRPLISVLCCRLRMSAEENPAAEPVPVIDVQGDGRWMSQVCTITEDCTDMCL